MVSGQTAAESKSTRTRIAIAMVTATVLSLAGCREKATNTPAAADTSGTRDTSAADTATVRKVLTPVEIRHAIQLLSQGVGHLENKEWVPAEAKLGELAQLLPANPTAVRNLAIARVLALTDRESPYSRSTDPAGYQKAVTAAADAVQALHKTVEADRPLSVMLLGRLRAHEDAPEKPTITEALALLRQAAIDSGDRPDFWFALAVAMDGHRDYSDSPELITALQKCRELLPQNLYALQKLLERQAMGLNSANPETKTLAAGLQETLVAARELIAPMNATILKQRRVDLSDVITKALAAAEGGNTSGLLGPAMMTKNLLLPELATQIDKRQIDRNLLDYVLVEFDPAFRDAARKAGVLPSLQPTVVTGFTPGPALPAVKGVTQSRFADMNLDGFDDLVVAAEGRIRVFSGQTDSTAQAAEWNLLFEAPAETRDVTGFLLVDIDRDFDRALSDIKSPMLLRDKDGDRKMVTDPAQQNRWFDTDLDVVAWSESAIIILRNHAGADGTRTLKVIPQTGTLTDIRDVVAADLDADGDLDLAIATSAGITLWKNVDGTVFEAMAENVAGPAYGVQALAIGDWNRDMAMDILGVTSDGAAGELQNMLHGRFRWVTDADGAGQIPKSSIVRIGDFDGNLSWDTLTAGADGITLSLTQMSAAHTMTSLRSEVLFAEAVTAMQLADLDNDGHADIVATAASRLVFLRGGPDGTFEDQSKLVSAGTVANGLCAADIDDDGDLDLVVTNAADGSLSALINDGGNSNHWLDVVARAVADDTQFPSNRINMHGIGSVMELRAGSAYQAHIVDQPRMHLGLGQAKSADALRVIWTDGVPQSIVVPELLRPRIGILCPQILKGSCPYIYTWTGERFEFFSDCLWAAPLGLVQANGDLAPTREWENLLIPGEQLVAKDGKYVLQLTEELWEAAYFDEVRLVAVDHPADVSVFTNEKVGSPAMAEHRIHTVKRRHLPKSVTDGAGNDLLSGLANSDGNYVQPFRGRIIQGLTDSWSMEFDPGLSTRPQSLRLVLIGWVFPTDTSLNLAIDQNPNLNPPAGPSIDVIGADVNWKTAMPFIGFPSGKTKAMVVDLSNVFETDDLRFRLNSSMELYFDEAFFIVDEEDAPTVVQACPLASADLHGRGFSRRVYADQSLFRSGHAPESYDYSSVTTEPRWPTMQGRFTRYGMVTDLLQQQDDQMVVMGPGDELTVSFTVAGDAVPAGWKRDFVLSNVGWDKDADLNTVYGQSSEPLPFKAMSQYPFAEGDTAPNSPDHQRYLDERQTREFSSRRFWTQVRDSQ